MGDGETDEFEPTDAETRCEDALEEDFDDESMDAYWPVRVQVAMEVLRKRLGRRRAQPAADAFIAQFIMGETSGADMAVEPEPENG